MNHPRRSARLAAAQKEKRIKVKFVTKKAIRERRKGLKTPKLVRLFRNTPFSYENWIHVDDHTRPLGLWCDEVFETDTDDISPPSSPPADLWGMAISDPPLGATVDYGSEHIWHRRVLYDRNRHDEAYGPDPSDPIRPELCPANLFRPVPMLVKIAGGR